MGDADVPITSSWFETNDDTIKQKLGYILENKDYFEKLRKELGVAYIIKFVTSLRSYGMQTEETWAPESDTVFINLLKILLEKRKEKLAEFVTNLQLVIPVADFLPDFKAFFNSCCGEEKDKCRKAIVAVFGLLIRIENVPAEKAAYYLLQLKQCLSLSLRCAAALAQLGTHWNTSPQKEVLFWKPPEAWSHPVDQSEPFESYLKARWGQKLPGLLGLQLKYIAWWNAPPRPKDTMIKQGNGAASGDMTNYTSGSTKLKVVTEQKKVITKASKLKPQKEPNMWLPHQYKRGDSFDPYYNKGILGGDFFGLFHKCPIKCRLDKSLNVKDPCNAMGEKWELESVSLRPALFGDLGIGHAINGSQAKLSIWACLWQHTSDYKLRLMQQSMHHVMLEKWNTIREAGPAHSENVIMKDWMEIMARSAGYINKVKDERGDENEASEIQDILLKPHLLAQLPWNSTLLQSWLIAALITIQKFEIESLELRHWPMHPEIETVARELLALVCHAKERVLFALALYFKMVLKDFEEPRYFQLILKEGVLPALPALELLSSKEGSQVLLEIKSIAWSQSCTKIDDMIFMNPQAYNPLPQLDTIFLNMMWHVKYWLTTDQDVPFPSKLLNAMYPLEVLAKLSDGRVPPAKSHENPVNPFNVQERGMFEHWYNPNADYYWLQMVPTVKLLAMTEEALKRVKNEGWFTELLIKPLAESYLKPAGKKCAEALRNVRGPENKLSFEMQIAIYGTYHLRFMGSLYGIDRRTEEFGWLIRLNGELLEREQLIRTAQVVSLYHGASPQLQGCYPYPRTCAQLLESVQCVARQRDLRTIDWLWSQLPAHWQQPVSLHIELPVVENGVSGIISQFEARLGALLGGVVKKSLPMLDKGGSMFPNWKVTQCLIPIYLGDLKACAKSSTAIVNFSKLIHQLLSKLEEEFLQWSSGIYVVGVDSGDEYDSNEIDPDLMVPVANLLQHQLDILLYTYVARHANLNTLPGFQEVASQVRRWWSPMPFIERKVEGELIVFKAWFKIAIKYTTLLLQACHIAWNIPIPEPVASNARCLKSLHFLSSVSEYIECTLDIFLLSNKQNYTSTKMHEWRKNLLIALSDSEDQNRVTVNEGEMWKRFARSLKSFRDMKDKIGIEYFSLPYWTGSEAMAVREVVISFVTGTPQEIDQLETNLKIFTGRICSNLECGTKEEEEGQFIMCESCGSTNSTHDVDVYCSEKCKNKWWKLEHMAQHLEWELEIA